MKKQKQINILKQTCFNHFFELQVAKLHKQGKIKIPIYLSLGTTHVPPCIREVNPDWIIFPQHRCHSYYLSFGGDPSKLLKELCSQLDGCNKGMGGSASISIKDKMFGHDGLLGSNLPIGAGYCHATNKPTLIHIGDAGIEEDYALAGLGYAVTKKLSLLTIVEDNGLSILTKTETRRSWDVVDVAKGFGMSAIQINDDPETIYNAVEEYSTKLPALINIKVCRHYWHAGSGQDNEPEWNTYELFKQRLAKHIDVDKMEQDIINQIENL